MITGDKRGKRSGEDDRDAGDVDQEDLAADLDDADGAQDEFEATGDEDVSPDIDEFDAELDDDDPDAAEADIEAVVEKSSKEQNARTLEVRRAIEARMEKKRLDEDIDYLDLDFED